MRRWLLELPAAALLLVYWILAYRAASTPARSFHDTGFYFKSAESGVFSSEVWAGERVPIPVLVFKACGMDAERVHGFFTLLSVAAWSVLAVSIASSVNARWLRALAVALVASLALSDEVYKWNAVVLSESLALSLTALLFAFGVLFLARSTRFLLPLLLCAFLLAFTRDSSGYFIAMLGAVAAVFVVARRFAKATWPLAAVAAGFLAVFVLGNSSADRGRRWVYPLVNVIVQRVLPDATAREEFVALGMPASPALRPRRPRRHYDSDPKLADFREWIDAHGKPAYVRYLLTHPKYLVLRPAETLDESLGGDLTHYTPRDFSRAEPEAFQRAWQPSAWWPVLLAVGLLALGSASLARARSSPLFVVGLLATLLVFPHVMVTWHGDAMEVPRHGLAVALQLRIALILLLVVALSGAHSLLRKNAKPELTR